MFLIKDAIDQVTGGTALAVEKVTLGNGNDERFGPTTGKQSADGANTAEAPDDRPVSLG